MNIQGLKLHFLIFLLTIMGLSACGGGGGKGSKSVAPRDADVTLVSIELTPGSQTLPKGVTQQYTATGIYSDGSTPDISNQVNWETTDATIASIGADGLATALASGAPIEVIARLGAISGSTPLTVSDAALLSIDVTPASQTLPKGLTQRYVATGVYTDGSTPDISTLVIWSSENSAIASADSTGLVRALNADADPIAITATLGALSSSKPLTVTDARLDSIAVTAAEASLAKGFEQSYTATGRYSDSSTQDLTSSVTWTSSDENVASIGNMGPSRGIASTLKVGKTTISATVNGVSGDKSLDVTAAVLQSIEVEAVSTALAKGYKQTYTATGTFSDGTTENLSTQVLWSSSDATIASISNADGFQGEATANSAGGPVDIVATLDNISGEAELSVSAAVLTSIEVTAASATLPGGLTQQYTATGTYSDNTTGELTDQVTWSSSDTNVASISNADGSEGLATGVAAGTTSISAAFDPGTGELSGSKTLEVTAAVLQTIEVDANSGSLALGFDLQYTATGIYSDDTTQDLTTDVTWSSSDEAVATISNADGSQGLASAVTSGSITISAAFDPGTGEVSGDKTLEVTTAVLKTIEVSSGGDSLAAGFDLQYTATGIYSDNSTQDLSDDVTWSSSDETMATISNADGSKGLASALTAGPTTISAALGEVSGERALNVTSATLQSIEVSSDSDTLVAGLTQQYTATGIYSDDSTGDLTDAVTWSVVPAGIASISNAAGSKGLLEALAAGGPVDVIATFGSGGSAIVGSTPLDVSAATLVSIAVTPADPSLPKGLSLQFTAMGTYTDDTVLDLTSQVIWASSDSALASISNAAGAEGLATAVDSGGPVSISASMEGISGHTDLTVTDATISSVSVTPADLNLPLYVRQQYAATATLSDGTTQDVTALATWSSSDNSVATISNADGSRGVASTLAAGGPIKIIATLSGFSVAPASTTLKVSNRVLTGIVVSPEAITCGYGRTQQFTATATFEDDTTQDVTTLVNWTSDNTKLVTIGLRTGLAKTSRPKNKAGVATVFARLSGVEGEAVITKLRGVNTACTP